MAAVAAAEPSSASRLLEANLISLEKAVTSMAAACSSQDPPTSTQVLLDYAMMSSVHSGLLK